jgi:hypothetical protein
MLLHMSPRRVVLFVTCLVVTGLCVWLAVVKWNSASKIATIVSALAGVAAVGIAMWAALPDSLRVSGPRAAWTGKAVARGHGKANSGVIAPNHKSAGYPQAYRTGDADASDDGEATSGIRLD